ncbi:MAG: secretion protein [Pirellulaceae bacterium]|nr:MAG: secretion protein [Pirellulaceae bacterium]
MPLRGFLIPLTGGLLLRRVWLAGVILSTVAGCAWRHDDFRAEAMARYEPILTKIEYADVDTAELSDERVRGSVAPHTVRDPEHKEYWDLSLDEAVQIALANSQVMRDIGGRVVAAPAAVSTIYDPALQESSPLSGVEAALAAFDAQFTSQLTVQHNERTFNNIFFGAGTTGFKQQTGDFLAEISKPSATGTRFAFRNITTYNRNTSPANRFPSVYETLFEGEFRHPLLQGSGLEFNRIAGPNARPGVYNGVLIARINTDIALADFEIAVRDLIRDVEQTYWELYFAYRDLDAKKRNRDAALELWRLVESQVKLGAADAERESLVREQYYSAQAAVEEALAGSPTGPPGVYTVERRLRRLMGLPATDDRIIRPADEPQLVEVRFDWRDSLEQAFWRRPELRRQQWQIKRRELELAAARNFRLGRLDLVGLYRWRGFGDDLFGNRNIENGSAFRDLFTGDLQEWSFGFQYSNPIGNRLGNTAVRHAELALARERAIYREQELQISHELAEAVAALDRAYVITKSNYNRRIAAYQQVKLSEIKVTGGRQPLEFYLDAIRRATLADSAYYRALADYQLALMQIHFVRGTLLSKHSVELAEGPWSEAAHRAAAHEARRYGPYRGAQCFEEPCPISTGEEPAITQPAPSSEPAASDDNADNVPIPAQPPSDAQPPSAPDETDSVRRRR